MCQSSLQLSAPNAYAVDYIYSPTIASIALAERAQSRSSRKEVGGLNPRHAVQTDAAERL